MTRRVVDARTRIGMLRSLGFATGSIMGVYLLYSGSAAELIDYDGVVTMFLTEDAAVRVEGMLQALVYIVLLVIVCSGALAFIVLFNLTNINVIEHLREIATVKVLGFSPRETAAYVFRENVLLTGLGALLGLPLGRALLFTFLFAAAVDVVMYFRLERIRMAEALKSAE